MKSVGKNTNQSAKKSTGKKTYLLSEPFPVEEVILGETKYDVLKFLYKEGNPHSISKELNIKRPTTVQHLNELIDKGLVKKGINNENKYGDPYKITEKGIFLLNKCVGFPVKSTRVGHFNPKKLIPNKVRGHGFQFKLEIPKNPDWKNREEILKKNNIPCKRISLFGGGHSILFKGKKIHLTNKSIIIYDTDSYISDLATEAHSNAIITYLRIIKDLERKSLFNTSFKIDGNYKFKVTRSHYALIKNSLARQYDKNGEKLYVYNTKGLYFLIDNSWNLHEAENIQNKEGEMKAISRNEGMQNWMDSMDKTNYEVTPTFLLESMNHVTQNQQIFAANMESHIKAIQDLSRGVNEFRDEIKQLKEKI